MSAGDRDTLTALLTEHWPVGWFNCHCGKFESDGLDHHAHLADVIASSDWLRVQRTEAWKAGHGWCDDGDGFCEHEPFTPNPYLEQDGE